MKLVSWNIHAFPIFADKNSLRVSQMRNHINNHLPRADKDELVAVCIQEAWAYRTNILTYPFELLFFFLSRFNNTHFIANFLQTRISNDIRANDIELIGILFNLIYRALLPFSLFIGLMFNFIAFDMKDWITSFSNSEDRNNITYYYNKGFNNKSLPSFWRFWNLYNLTPGYDSGCMIMSNKPATENGYVRWDTWGMPQNTLENRANKGMVWTFFESDNTLLITFHAAGASAPGTYEKQFNHLVEFANQKRIQLQTKYLLDSLDVYLFGDTNTEFTKEPNRLKILNDAGFLKKTFTQSTLMHENKEIDVLFSNTAETGTTYAIESELSDHKMIMWETS